MTGAVHVRPVEDAIEHDATTPVADCVCGPLVFPYQDDDDRAGLAMTGVAPDPADRTVARVLAGGLDDWTEAHDHLALSDRLALLPAQIEAMPPYLRRTVADLALTMPREAHRPGRRIARWRWRIRRHAWRLRRALHT